MIITINNKEIEWEDKAPLTLFIKKKNYKRVSVWVNDIQLSNEEIESYIPCEGDKIRLMRLVGGG